MDWKTLAEKIVQDDQNKWDRRVSGQELRISGDAGLELVNGGSANHTYSLSDLATTEMCQRLDIPVKYFRRLPNEMKAAVGNYDLKRQMASRFSCAAKLIGSARFYPRIMWPTTIPRYPKSWKDCS